MFGISLKNKKPVLPPDMGIQWIAELENKNRTYYTPDVHHMEEHPWQMLFMYGEDMPGYVGHELIAPNLYSTPVVGFTQDHFSMYEKEPDDAIFPGKTISYPVALSQAFHGVPNHSIKGKVGLINSDLLYELDIFRKNGKVFKRKRVRIIMSVTRYRWTKAQGSLPPEQTVSKKWAWMYVGVPEFWKDHIDAGYTSVPIPKTESKSPWQEDYIFYDPVPF